MVDRLRATQPVRRSVQIHGQSRTDTSKFRAELNALPRTSGPPGCGVWSSEQVSLILRRSIDPDRPLPEYGLDSLGNLELRTRIETETGIRLSPKAIATHNTVRACPAPVRHAGRADGRTGGTIESDSAAPQGSSWAGDGELRFDPAGHSMTQPYSEGIEHSSERIASMASFGAGECP